MLTLGLGPGKIKEMNLSMGSIQFLRLENEFMYVHCYVFSFFFFLLFCVLFFLRAIPTAYGSSRARGQIGAAATGLCHSHSNSKSEP